MVSIVATPEVLAEASRIAALTAPRGLPPVPKLLRGAWRGRRNPVAYSPHERDAFRPMAATARAAYAPLLAERPTIDPFDDDAMLTGVPNHRGGSAARGATLWASARVAM